MLLHLFYPLLLRNSKRVHQIAPLVQQLGGLLADHLEVLGLGVLGSRPVGDQLENLAVLQLGLVRDGQLGEGF
jgi:hypothetical protein